MEEKKKYTNPQIEAIMIELGDVVTTSSEGGGETDPTQNEYENHDY